MFRVSFGMLVTSVLFLGVDRVAAWRRGRRELRSLRRVLRDLTPEEKAVLAEYIRDDAGTQYFSIRDGVVQGLQAKGVLYRASVVSRGRDIEFAFNIQPWAREYLRENQHLLMVRVDQ